MRCRTSRCSSTSTPHSARARLDADDKPFDRLEAEKAEFHERVRAAYLRLAAAEPERFLVLDAARPADELADAVRERVASVLREGDRGRRRRHVVGWSA